MCDWTNGEKRKKKIISRFFTFIALVISLGRIFIGLLTHNAIVHILASVVGRECYAPLFIFRLCDIAPQKCFVTMLLCKYCMMVTASWNFNFELLRSSLQPSCAASANETVIWRTSVLKTSRRLSWSLCLRWTTASEISLMGSANCATVRHHFTFCLKLHSVWEESE